MAMFSAIQLMRLLMIGRLFAGAATSCAGELAYQQPQEVKYAVGGLRPGRA
jgi:hypothetical protein